MWSKIANFHDYMKRLFFITVVFFFLSSSSFSTELTILTENLPPLNYVENGILVGPAVEMIKEIQKRIGSNDPIHVYPWARAYRIAVEEENIVLFGIARTNERQDKFRWIGPLARKRDIFVAKKGALFKITSLEDAKKVKRIGTIRGDAKEEFLKMHGFRNMVPTNDERKNVQKLLLGRIDLWVYKQPGLKIMCELAGVDANLFEEVYRLREFEISIGFSKRSSDKVFHQWESTFSEMVSDGTIEKIKLKWNIQ